MNHPETIRTIKVFNEAKFKEKGSIFLSQVYRINSEDEAIEIINNVKKKYFDATHHCYAYKLLTNKSKYSDDGEPPGTAGLRILNSIEHFNLTNQLVIVIRYFGRTKLGIGPLGKAYYEAALKALNESQILTTTLYKRIKLSAGFENINAVHKLLNNKNIKIEKTDYDDKVNFTLLVKKSALKSIISKLKESSSGAVEIADFKEIVYI